MRDQNGKTIRGRRSGANRRRDSQDAIRLRDIHSKIADLPAGTHKGHVHNMHGSSATAAIADAAKYFECALIEERPETHVVPRQSQTRKQLLGVFPAQVEYATIPGKQLDHVSKTLVQVDNRRIEWKQDSTLLRRGSPFKAPNDFKREGTVSVGLNTRKYREHVAEPEPMETVLGPAVDDVDFDS